MDAILKAQVSAFQVLLFDALAKLCDQITAFCKPHLALSKKDFVKMVQALPKDRLPGPATLCYAVFDAVREEGEDPMDIVIKNALKMASNTKSLEELRGLLGGIAFTERIGAGGNRNDEDEGGD